MKTSHVKPIETLYAGCRFRSRTEARYALFFDALGIRWQYEVEGYETPYGRYLPDFWLPDQEYSLEVKPEFPTEDEQRKLAAVGEFLDDKKGGARCRKALITCEPVTAIHGVFDSPPAMMQVYPTWDMHYYWCRCLECGRCEVHFQGRTDRMTCKDRCAKSVHGDKGFNANDPVIARAFAKASMARFEHGEKP